MIRTHEAGTLREEHAGHDVVLAGWVARRRDHGGVAFLDLRDASGVVQVVVRENDIAHDLRAEFCVKVTGSVRVRPDGNRNDALPTGTVEVDASSVEVLSAAAALPFQLDDHRPERPMLPPRHLDDRGQVLAAQAVWGTGSHAVHVDRGVRVRRSAEEAEKLAHLGSGVDARRATEPDRHAA